MMVQRFDKKGDIRRGCRGVPQILNEAGLRLIAGRKSRHDMYLWRIDHGGIGDRLVDGGTRLPLAPDQRRQTVLTSRDVAAHRIQP